MRKHTTLVLRPPPSEPPSDAKPLQPPSSPVKPILKGPSILRRRRLERARALVSQAVGHSRHRTLLRAKAKKDKKVEFCLFFNRFGKCNKADTCPYIHDKDKVRHTFASPMPCFPSTQLHFTPPKASYVSYRYIGASCMSMRRVFPPASCLLFVCPGGRVSQISQGQVQ